MKKRIAFIGAGKMAEALLSGILRAGLADKKNIIVSDIDNVRREFISKKYKVKNTPSNVEAVKKSGIIILSVKPAQISDVISQILPAIKKDHLVISIAAGIKIKSIEKKIRNCPVVRVMPNTPCLMQRGMTAISSGAKATKKDVDTASSIFSAVGHVVRVPEKLMDAVTALSGSGPAFVYFFVASMIEGGVESGLSYNLARILAVETIFGASYMLKHGDKSPEELIAMVASPGGTTISGLSVMEKNGLNDIVSNAIIEAYKRSIEISNTPR